jgi:hypothetical protein
MKGYSWGYSINNHAYRVFYKRTEVVMESINVVIDDEEVKASSRGGEKFSPFLKSYLLLQLKWSSHLPQPKKLLPFFQQQILFQILQ